MLKLMSGRFGIVPQSNENRFNIKSKTQENFTDDVLSTHHRSSTQGLVDSRHLLHRSGNERGPGVSDGLTAGLTITVSSNSDAVHLELPVSFPCDGHVGEVSRVVTGEVRSI